uniref:Uncharacterized protein n=1 Tax=Plectus sambesii TaxID=2011161 RepID=A0A914WY12_9BILA
MLPYVFIVFVLFCAYFPEFVFSQIVPVTNDCPHPAGVLRATSSRQLLLTPGFVNGQYPPNLDCSWILKAQNQRSRVELTVFISRIEDRLFTDCDDFIEVLDGEQSGAPVAARWCGSTHPFSITSSTDSLYVRFKTDANFELRGANMSFVDYEPPQCPQGWLFAATGDNCYKLWSPRQRVTWVEAQRLCMYDRSNLLTVSSADEYRSVIGMYSVLADEPWIGYSDAQFEGTFASVNPTDPVWPPK